MASLSCEKSWMLVKRTPPKRYRLMNSSAWLTGQGLKACRG